MSLLTQIQALATRVGVEIKAVRAEKVSKALVVANPNSAASFVGDIESDNSSSSGWNNRSEWWYKAWGGVRKLVSWINEYGEIRVAPALWNTVALRVFLSRDTTEYDARSTTVPGFEVTDKRDGTRVTVFGIFKHGQIQQHGKVVGTVHTLEAGQTADDIPDDMPTGTFIVRKLS